MKIVYLSVIFLFSFQIHAAACKCNCDPTNNQLCASQNDLDNPCPSVCTSAPGLGPMFTACPVSKITDPITGITGWVNLCNP